MALPLAYTSESVTLCADCRALFAALDDMIDTYHREGTDHRRSEKPLKWLDQVQNNAHDGCRMCKYLVARHDGREGCDPRLAAVLRIDHDDDEPGYIGFMRPRDEEQMVFCENGLIAATLDFRVLPDLASPPPTLDSRTDSAQIFGQISKWLNECDTKHGCRRWSTINGIRDTLPVRLLYIDSSTGDSYLRLVDGSTSPRDTRYITLSHCWGHFMALRLTQDTCMDMTRGLLVSTLPNTFKDTVYAARSLGVRYLWIDALCIMQDSLLDWQRQAQDMAMVYANAYLNIAATDSDNSEGGLFRTRDLTHMQAFLVPSDAGRAYLCYLNTFHDDISQGALNSRAWVVQERFLASRVLHFCRQQVHWECLECMTSENLNVGFSASTGTFAEMKTLGPSLGTLLNIEAGIGRSSESAAYNLWNNLLGHYTGASLSFESDRAVAAHALAIVICRHLGHDFKSAYVNGIWHDRFVDGLMWFSHPFYANLGFRNKSGACSWSWLSMQGGIWSHYLRRDYHGQSDLEPSTQTIAKLVDVEAACTLVVPTAEASGHAILQAPLCMATMCTADLDTASSTLMARRPYNFKIGDETVEYISHMDLRLDGHKTTDQPSETPQQVVLLLGRASRSPHQPNHIACDSDSPYYGAGAYECLILEPVTRQRGTFRRIGYVRFVKMVYSHTQESENQIQGIDLKTCQALDVQFRCQDIPEHLYHSVDDDYMYEIRLV